jgi:hypothetical protein
MFLTLPRFIRLAARPAKVVSALLTLQLNRRR